MQFEASKVKRKSLQAIRLQFDSLKSLVSNSGAFQFHLTLKNINIRDIFQGIY